ncbi:MAG TPA: hypothetical protein GX520_11560 [Syntrophaceticus sp.]|jgi:hypothetical protein|nr:hypothetical protein [Syntrophaceticus sp.]
MALKDKRRLEIWLPADHPIFSYPSGVRATIARERLDMDMRLADMKKSLVEPSDSVVECCLLPYPSGVDSVKRIYSRDFVDYINQTFPGVKESDRPLAYFEWRGDYITILHTNELVKRQALIKYLIHVQKWEGHKSIILCTPHQANDIRIAFQNYNVEVVIDSGTEKAIQEPAPAEEEDSFVSFSNFHIPT